MELELSGKKAVVTGAGQGIGLAVVRALAEAGADVYGGARTVGPELREATKYTMEVDLATPDGPGRLVEAAREELGGVDVLVNNVGGGVSWAASFLDIDDDVWRRSFELNLFSTVRASRAALPGMVERGGGTIVNIGSANGRLADPQLAHYAAAKAALANLGKALSVEFSPKGVRVNTISPGPVRTRIWTKPQLAKQAGMTPEEFVRSVPGKVGLTTGALVEPEEIAALVVLLASGRIPSVTGADLSIDAGLLKIV
ncbi:MULTISPECIES: SDR family NAD(P)-dependent oxidoreductase [Actinomadura]|uniref:SDR family NAD(P)-dependent oxidoreductase n=1 Tax=Actinomadura yumaensis TaxID=111807 RepID=A0ABW2CN79_9ACTN|nr:SDR family NAD(P)-dependent oxidoreductase [Actinomadura sp. J1-007]MWK36718.1 SDR family NAD(P)-dependent oxidoreductase [Actinomadura sp. J1-007]